MISNFTIKDFINYNNPCFCCGNSVSLKMFSSADEIMGSGIVLIPAVYQNALEVDLEITYLSTLKLKIYPKTNKFISSSHDSLTKYLQGRKLSLISRCDGCSTFVKSLSLEFNLDREFIKPLSIEEEMLFLYDKDFLFRVRSLFKNNYSELLIIKYKKPSETFKLTMPLQPRSKFKNTQQLLKKIKTLMLFS